MAAVADSSSSDTWIVVVVVGLVVLAVISLLVFAWKRGFQFQTAKGMKQLDPAVEQADEGHWSLELEGTGRIALAPHLPALPPAFCIHAD